MLRVLASLALLLAVLSPSAEAVNYPQGKDLATARSNPYVFVGQLYFTSGRTDYIGSGTVVRARSVLTAGHNVYDPQGGWSTAVEFRRSAYGASALNDLYASRLLVLGGYRASANSYGSESLHTFHYDMGGLIFAKDLAGGTHANIGVSTTYLGKAYPRTAVGYGAETHSGDYPLYVSPTTNFYPVYGSYWECSSLTFEGGMSGGPLFSSTQNGMIEVAVIVASSGPPEAGGVRIIDQAAASFINNYLY
jgi:V8-like Glu-specific endopeptidase